MSSQAMGAEVWARFSTASCTRFSPTARQAVAGGPVHGFGRVRLGDGEQPYRSRRPARARAGFPDAGQDCVRPLLEFLKVGRRSGH